MKKFRIEAEITLAANGPRIVEWLEDAHLTDGLDPAHFALQYAPTGVEKLLDLGYTESEAASARFVMQPTKLQLVWGETPPA